MRRLGAFLGLLIALLIAAIPARGGNTYFPHGFVILRGSTEDGAPVSGNYGFTARNIFINVLWERVTGEMDPTPLPPGYVEGANHRFSLTLTDAQYRAVLATVAQLAAAFLRHR